ncbi:MAG TPA: cytochrome c [Nitrospira sp.]|nr:cytochrome c [Nitrospira sp.]
MIFQSSAKGLLLLASAVVLTATAACDASQPKSAVGDAAVPAELKAGEAKFNAHCAACHGPQATGTKQGPPLVHKIYEPNHHGDAAFQRAAEFGVRAHHWEFGNMPKIDGVSSADVEQITRYIRWLQRQAGIS